MPETDAETFVEWYKGGNSLYMERGYEIDEYKGILNIKSVAKEHAGTYTCEGVNGYGYVQVNITVIVDSKCILKLALYLIPKFRFLKLFKCKGGGKGIFHGFSLETKI